MMREYSPRDALKVQFEDALRSNDEKNIDLNNQASCTIAEMFFSFVYRQRQQPVHSASVRALYSDGSRGERINLRSIERRPYSSMHALSTLRPLRVAMISMRHDAMDPLVDMAWFLNCEVSQPQMQSSIERLSYDRSRQLFEEGLRPGLLKLHFYQTGYQPVVVGFYRALIDMLKARASQAPALEVIPFYYSWFTQQYYQGHSWH